MKRVSGLGLALTSVSLLSLPALAAPDPAPTLATDTQSGATTLTSAHHVSGAAFSLVVIDWWLSGTIANGQAQDVQLVVEVHLPTYPLLDHATDAAGRKLDLVILHRGPSTRWPRKVSERVAVVLPRADAEKTRTGSLSITVAGKDRSFAVAVPADIWTRFLDSYAQAARSSGTPSAPPLIALASPAPAAQADDDDPAITPLRDKRVRRPDGSFAPTPPTPPRASPPGSTIDKAQPADSDQTDGGGGHGIWINPLGLEFVPTSSGAMVLTIRPGSIAAAKGIEGGDFIETVDGVSIKTLDGPQMAAKIGSPTARTLHMIAVGDVRIR